MTDDYFDTTGCTFYNEFPRSNFCEICPYFTQCAWEQGLIDDANCPGKLLGIKEDNIDE